MNLCAAQLLQELKVGPVQCTIEESVDILKYEEMRTAVKPIVNSGSGQLCAVEWALTQLSAKEKLLQGGVQDDTCKGKHGLSIHSNVDTVFSMLKRIQRAFSSD